MCDECNAGIGAGENPAAMGWHYGYVDGWLSIYYQNRYRWLYLNAGWCYGGFKAIPGSGWCFAHTIAEDAPHEINQLLTLDRFREGRQIDETGHGPFPKAH